MHPDAAFISGDWGTSNLRLFLCDAAGKLLAQNEGPGAAGLREDMGAVLDRLVAPWDKAYGKLPAILCGMVGSSIGWREVPYLLCPAQSHALASGALRMTSSGRDVALLPGLTCRNRLGVPDVMRGEETQISGVLQSDPRFRAGKHLLCMPGTHTKWVLLDDGAVMQFQTALSGELYDMLRRHSILLGGKGETAAAGGTGFAQAMDIVRAQPESELMHMLFSTRSRQLAGELAQADAAAYLSGLIIGQDIAGARRFFRDEMKLNSHIILVGAPALTTLYIQALGAFGLSGQPVDGNGASIAGLKHGYDILFGRQSHVA